ncbi:MAG: ABC transporter permease [Clostridia bacterium]|nr:ABC transporter permease [Clostridia bacterium]
MTKYLLKRLLRGFLSIVMVVAIIMILIYTFINRKNIFGQDTYWTKVSSNQRTVYEYTRWEEYGYLDLVMYTDWLNDLIKNGELAPENRDKVANIGKKIADDTPEVAEYVKKFTEYYQNNGYTVKRLEAKMLTSTKYLGGGKEYLFAFRDKPLISRLWNYFSKMISVDNIHYVEEDIGERGIKLTLHDPVYGGDKFAPALIGNGTKHKYLLYFDDRFPFIHQNLVTINIGTSYSINQGIDIVNTMTDPQGKQEPREVIYPTGLVEQSCDNLHTATYSAGSRDKSIITQERFTDDYTKVTLYKNGLSKIGYSFIIGIISTIFAYALGIPIGVIMARNKDKLIDKLGTIYIVFIIAVPSLAYIFMFRAFGSLFGLPTTFMMEDAGNALMYVLPIVSLGLPSVAGFMRWLRRYMIDQMNSDYVKFARSGGLSENEIFRKHILKNAAIPIIHGIPGAILGSVVGGIITERVYVVPGTGNLLTSAINAYDNGVIVGITLFYATITIVSLILGDILMSMVDPRISFTTKAR